MTKRTKPAAKPAASKDLAYEIVTERIVELLQQGTAPWRQPWNLRTHAPRNIEGYRYRGINVFLLLAHGYGSPYWMTYRQAKERGGHVNAGEHGSTITFWKRLTIQDDEASAAQGKPVYKTIPMLKFFTVFNLEQCTDVRLPANPILPAPIEHDSDSAIAEADAILAGMPNPPRLIEAGTQAYYRPSADTVNIPPRGRFDHVEQFYSTAFHEFGHATGHVSRLARKEVGNGDSFGSYNYGREELVAEMTAAFLCGESGILPATIENTAAYLAGWVRTIKQDVKAVVVAAGAAQRAADYILKREREIAEPEPARQAA